MTPPTILMRLGQPLRLNEHQHLVGAVVELGVDVARQLWHQRRAVPAKPADLAALEQRLRDEPG